MNEQTYLQSVKKCTDINLQLIETLLEITSEAELKSDLKEMLEFTLELNWNLYTVTAKKLQEYDVL